MINPLIKLNLIIKSQEVANLKISLIIAIKIKICHPKISKEITKHQTSQTQIIHITKIVKASILHQI
jgi:hypothetical protein